MIERLVTIMKGISIEDHPPDETTIPSPAPVLPYNPKELPTFHPERVHKKHAANNRKPKEQHLKAKGKRHRTAKQLKRMLEQRARRKAVKKTV